MRNLHNSLITGALEESIVAKASDVKSMDVMTVGVAESDRQLLGAFLELIVLADGQAFRLSDQADAPIVIFNPASSEAAALLSQPQRGVALIQYGMPEQNSSRGVWYLMAPVRLAALRVIMTGIMTQRREWQMSGVLETVEVRAKALPVAPSSASAAVAPLPLHRKLEQFLGVLASIVQSRIPHAITGIPGVEIVVFPLENAVYIQCDSAATTWSKALAGITRPVAAFSRVGAKPMAEVKPITVEQLRWELARHLSAGSLLPGLANFVEFGLARWPDFGTMPASTGYDLRIVALISARPTSIANMLRVVPYSREGIIALLNGCALIGCMRDAPADLLAHAELVQRTSSSQPDIAKTPIIATRAEAPEVKQEGRFSGMLSKLRAALSFVPRANS